VHTHIDAPARRARPGGHSARFRRDPRLSPRDGAADDARVVVAAQAGDPEALRELYLRFKDNVYGYVCSIVRDEHEAEDVTQQVFAKLLDALHTYRPVGEVPFSGWLLRIARNMAIDHLRQRRPMPEEELPDAGTLPIDRMLATFTLRSALEGLPEDQRRVVVLRHVVGLSPPEIAVRLGRTESSVHALHHRGRQRLRDELRREGAMPASRRVAAAY
jgi:RNA polymerase sigma-70 factor (ECF subfamily)